MSINDAVHDYRDSKTTMQRILDNHEYVYTTRDVSMDEREMYDVQFKTCSLPRAIMHSDSLKIRDVWVGCVPSWYLRPIAKKWAMSNGLGSPRIAAQIEVIE